MKYLIWMAGAALLAIVVITAFHYLQLPAAYQMGRLFIDETRQTTLFEWLAVIFGVIEVLLAVNDNIWLYPAGILSTIFSVYLLLEVQLFADALLNVYYLVMSIYGWIIWKKSSNKPVLKITYASKNEWLIATLISFGGWAFLYVILKNFTPSNVPVWDALVSATAWAGTWLLARRKMENWLFLNISNIFAIPLLFYKHLPMFSVLTIVLFIVAFVGYFKWQKIYLQEQLAL